MCLYLLCCSDWANFIVLSSSLLILSSVTVSPGQSGKVIYVIVFFSSIISFPFYNLYFFPEILWFFIWFKVIFNFLLKYFQGGFKTLVRWFQYVIHLVCVTWLSFLIQIMIFLGLSVTCYFNPGHFAYLLRVSGSYLLIFLFSKESLFSTQVLA